MLGVAAADALELALGVEFGYALGNALGEVKGVSLGDALREAETCRGRWKLTCECARCDIWTC